MTLPTMKAGDRVRITVEGEVISNAHESVVVDLDGPSTATTFAHDELTAPTARVEVLPPPVDPDLVLARETCKRFWPNYGTGYTDGNLDTYPEVQATLAAIKASKAGGRV